MGGSDIWSLSLGNIKIIKIVDLMTYKMYRSLGFGTFILNVLIQRVFRINGKLPFMVHYTSRVNSAKGITIIEDSSKSIYNSFAVSLGCYIQAKNGVTISSSAIFAPGVKIISANHNINDYKEHVSDKPITIGRNVWIGTNCVILPGVTIGDGSIIGAGSVVTKDMPANHICTGIPCRPQRLVK